MKNIFATRPVPAAADIDNGTVRAVIDAVLPCVDNGRFPVKCVAGERVQVRAHCFTDGHDVLRVQLCWRAHDQAEFREVPMKPQGNDVWEASFSPPSPGRYVYTAVAWVDPFDSWRYEMARRVDAADLRVACLLYTSPSPRDGLLSRMPSSA